MLYYFDMERIGFVRNVVASGASVIRVLLTVLLKVLIQWRESGHLCLVSLWVWVEFVGGSVVQSVQGGTSGVQLHTVKG